MTRQTFLFAPIPAFPQVGEGASACITFLLLPIWGGREGQIQGVTDLRSVTGCLCNSNPHLPAAAGRLPLGKGESVYRPEKSGNLYFFINLFHDKTIIFAY